MNPSEESRRRLFATLAKNFGLAQPYEAGAPNLASHKAKDEGEEYQAFPSKSTLKPEQAAWLDQIIDHLESQSIDLQTVLENLGDPPRNEFTRTAKEATAAESEVETRGSTPPDTDATQSSHPTRLYPTGGDDHSFSLALDVLDSASQKRITADDERYEIQEILAEGGLGRVSIARDLQLCRDVALKQIKPEHSDNSISQRRFVFEAAVTGQLEHPGIVPVYSLGKDGAENPFYTMRLIEGKSLRQAIADFHRASKSTLTGDRALAFRQLLRRFVDVCQAMDFAHSRGIIHRDLKPANIMIGSYGETFVVDWGLARQLSETADSASGNATQRETVEGDLTQQGTVIGTPAYMSPEQATGNVDDLGPASDIFSLGTILYSILTGKKTFPQDSAKEILAAVREAEFISPRRHQPKLAKALQAICQKALAVVPDDRYHSAGQLADDIERWLADEPVTAFKEPLANQVNRWVRRNRSLVSAAAAVLVATMIGLVIVLTLQARANRDLAKANERETASREFAQTQFDLALDAIGQYHSGVSNDFILRQKEFEPLRQTLLTSPKNFYAQLTSSLENYPDLDSGQRKALIESHVQLALLASKLDDQKLARSEFESALELLEEIRSEYSELEYQVERAELHDELGILSANLGQSERSKNYFNDAIQSLENVKDRENQSVINPLLARLRGHHAYVLTTYSEPKIATREFQAAVKLRRDIAEQKNDDQSQANLAMGLGTLSNHLADIGKKSEAIKAGEEAIQLLTELKENQTSDLEMVENFAGMLTNLAYLYQEEQRFDEAMKLYNQAEEAYRLLYEEAPNVASFKVGLASTLNNMGLLYADKQDQKQAEAYFSKTIRLKEQLQIERPDLVDRSVSLGGGYVNFGFYYQKSKDYENAILWYGMGIKVLGAVVEQNPKLTRASLFLRNAHMNRARAHRRLKHHLLAARDFEKAISLSQDQGQNVRMRNEMTQMYAFAGDHVKASELASNASKSAVSDSDFYNLAFIQALALQALEKDAKVDAEEKKKRTDLYVSRAIRDLRAMYKTEKLTRTQFLDLLKNNPYLKTLNHYEAFLEFRKEFE